MQGEQVHVLGSVRRSRQERHAIRRAESMRCLLDWPCQPFQKQVLEGTGTQRSRAASGATVAAGIYDRCEYFISVVVYIFAIKYTWSPNSGFVTSLKQSKYLEFEVTSDGAASVAKKGAPSPVIDAVFVNWGTGMGDEFNLDSKSCSLLCTIGASFGLSKTAGRLGTGGSTAKCAASVCDSRMSESEDSSSRDCSCWLTVSSICRLVLAGA